MSAFLFPRRTTQDAPNPAPAARKPDRLPAEAGQAQAITTAAIFAMLVSKGILSGEEADKLMNELGEALQREVGGELGDSAGNTLRLYGRALKAADA